ncbi:hypothetical protein R8Z50_16755 [Longispora sp. K20-0274]|uniref:hypothetical protein n=1 Tax=Longispora sp. K20-0274 TaxID=3088255 RepID=UPI00399B66FD
MAETAARATDADQVGRALPLRDVRMRLPHLAALARAAGQVTVIVDDRTNQPLAALVPVATARAAGDARAAEARIGALESRLAAAEERTRVAVARARAELRLADDRVLVATEEARAARDQTRAAEERARAAEERARVAEERAAASSAGWARRCETLRADLRRQHGAELAAARRELAHAWAELHRISPPGTDREVDRLRAAQREFLTDAA